METSKPQKTSEKIFAKQKLIDCKRQISTLKRVSCSSNFSTNKPTFKTIRGGKSSCYSDYYTLLYYPFIILFTL